MRGYERIDLEQSTVRDVGVEPGERLTLYTSAAVSYSWKRSDSDASPQLWLTTAGPAMTWPVDVPENVRFLRITAPLAASAIVRIAVNKP